MRHTPTVKNRWFSQGRFSGLTASTFRRRMGLVKDEANTDKRLGGGRRPKLFAITDRQVRAEQFQRAVLCAPDCGPSGAGLRFVVLSESDRGDAVTRHSVATATKPLKLPCRRCRHRGFRGGSSAPRTPCQPDCNERKVSSLGTAFGLPNGNIMILYAKRRPGHATAAHRRHPCQLLKSHHLR